MKQGQSSFTTSNLVFTSNACFVVRLQLETLADQNLNEVCTNHTPFVFGGLASLGSQAGGRFALAWAAVPDTGAIYSVYSRVKTGRTGSATYVFKANPLLKVGENTVLTPAFPLNETRCFVVRFASESVPAGSDKNSKEVCSDEDGVSDFSGVDAVTSTVSGQVKISWIPSVAREVVGYRV